VGSGGSLSFSSEFRVNQHTASRQLEAQVIRLADDSSGEKVLVLFASEDPVTGDTATPGVSGRIGTVQGDGSVVFGNEFLVSGNAPDTEENEARVTQLADGRIFVTYMALNLDTPGDLYFELRGRVGTLQGDDTIAFGTEFTVNEFSVGDNQYSDILQLSDGRVMVVYESDANPGADADGYGLLGRIGTVQDDGSVVFGDEFQINNFETGDQTLPQLTQLDDGRILVAFETEDNSAGDTGTGEGISGRIIDLDGLGTADNDTLVVVDGTASTLEGLDGNDLLIGGLAATDTLTGGTGADTFVLNSLAASDIITDYDYAEGDKIDLGALLDTAFSGGSLPAHLVKATEGPGGDVLLEVDIDGLGTAHGFEAVATLQDHTSMGDTIRVVIDNRLQTNPHSSFRTSAATLRADPESSVSARANASTRASQASEIMNKDAPAARSKRWVPALAMQLRCRPSGMTNEGLSAV
jgi:hypothetical protein